MKRGLLTGSIALLGFLPSGVLFAAPILPGNLVVTQVGDGAAALTSGGTATFLREYTQAGAPVQTINLPTTTSGAQLRYVASGTQVEQFPQVSSDGNYVLMGGYDAALGTATVGTSTVNRVVGKISVATGIVDTATNAPAGNSNNRTVTSTDGNTFYLGTGTGVYHLPGTGTQTATQIATTNSRNALIVGSQLYDSSGSAGFRGVNSVSGGLPTTSGQTLTRIPGQTDASNASSWDYVFANSTTLYVADDSSSATVGGLQKWTFDGVNWVQQYRIFTDNAAVTFGLRGLAGYDDGAGNFVLFATTNQTQTRLVTITDSIAATSSSATFTVLATSATNTQFRGVEYIPVVPEPASLGLVAAAGLMALRRRRA